MLYAAAYVAVGVLLALAMWRGWGRPSHPAKVLAWILAWPLMVVWLAVWFVVRRIQVSREGGRSWPG